MSVNKDAQYVSEYRKLSEYDFGREFEYGKIMYIAGRKKGEEELTLLKKELEELRGKSGGK